MEVINIDSLKKRNACKEGIEAWLTLFGVDYECTIIEMIGLSNTKWEHRKFLLFGSNISLVSEEVKRAFFLFCGSRLDSHKEEFLKACYSTKPYKKTDFSKEIIDQVEDKKAEELLQSETLKDFIINGVPTKYLHKGR